MRAARAGVDWTVWAIVLSDDIPDGLREVRAWPWRDIVEAHAVIESLAEIRALRREHQEMMNG